MVVELCREIGAMSVSIGNKTHILGQFLFCARQEHRVESWVSFLHRFHGFIFRKDTSDDNNRKRSYGFIYFYQFRFE
jgi:hypothetical protein